MFFKRIFSYSGVMKMFSYSVEAALFIVVHVCIKSVCGADLYIQIDDCLI